MKRRLRRILSWTLLALLAIVLAYEEVQWRLSAVFALLGKLPVLHQIENWVRRLPPYGALALFSFWIVGKFPALFPNRKIATAESTNLGRLGHWLCRELWPICASAINCFRALFNFAHGGCHADLWNQPPAQRCFRTSPHATAIARFTAAAYFGKSRWREA